MNFYLFYFTLACVFFGYNRYIKSAWITGLIYFLFFDENPFKPEYLIVGPKVMLAVFSTAISMMTFRNNILCSFLEKVLPRKPILLSVFLCVFECVFAFLVPTTNARFITESKILDSYIKKYSNTSMMVAQYVYNRLSIFISPLSAGANIAFFGILSLFNIDINMKHWLIHITPIYFVCSMFTAFYIVTNNSNKMSAPNIHQHPMPPINIYTLFMDVLHVLLMGSILVHIVFGKSYIYALLHIIIGYAFLVWYRMPILISGAAIINAYFVSCYGLPLCFMVYRICQMPDVQALLLSITNKYIFFILLTVLCATVSIITNSLAIGLSVGGAILSVCRNMFDTLLIKLFYVVVCASIIPALKAVVVQIVFKDVEVIKRQFGKKIIIVYLFTVVFAFAWVITCHMLKL